MTKHTVGIYDLTPNEKQITEWRTKKRLNLRNEYIKEMHNPNSTQNGHIFDEQLQRQYSARFTMEKFFKPTTKNFIWFFSITVAFTASLSSFVKKSRDEQEYRFRNGQVSYRDRSCKFV